LENLAVCDSFYVIYAGISSDEALEAADVLDLKGLPSITGMCAICEDREPTLCFIT
jgi:hypothetical protein